MLRKKKKHKGAFHALSIGETQGKEVCYRRRYGEKKKEETQGTTRKNNQPTPQKTCTRSLSTGEENTVGQKERYVLRITHATHFCYASTGPLLLLSEPCRRPTTRTNQGMTHPTNHTPQAHTRTRTAATPRTTPPYATHTNRKGHTAHTHTPRPRRRAPRAPTTTTSGPQPGVEGNHAHGQRPGEARGGDTKPQTTGTPHTCNHTHHHTRKTHPPHHHTTPPTTQTPQTRNAQHSTATAHTHTHHKHTQQRTPPPAKHTTTTGGPQPGVAGSRTQPPAAKPSQEWRGVAHRNLR